MVRVVAQRVRTAAVSVDGETHAEIGLGLALLVGIAEGDTEPDVDRIADKIATLRIFEDADGKMNLSASDVGGEILVVSQFTLLADLRKGRRPSFIGAEEPEAGRVLVERFAARLEASGYSVGRGQFGAEMLVQLEND